MQVNLYTCNAEKKRIDKTQYLSNRVVLEGSLRNESDVVNPYIVINTGDKNPSLYNYAYLPDFKRYYYVTDMKSIRNGIWGISLHVDVLYTYGAAIKVNKGLVDRVYNAGDSNLYLDDGTFVTDARKYTQIISFPNSLDEEPHTILIAAGGEPT